MGTLTAITDVTNAAALDNAATEAVESPTTAIDRARSESAEAEESGNEAEGNTTEAKERGNEAEESGNEAEGNTTEADESGKEAEGNTSEAQGNATDAEELPVCRNVDEEWCDSDSFRERAYACEGLRSYCTLTCAQMMPEHFANICKLPNTDEGATAEGATPANV